MLTHNLGAFINDVTPIWRFSDHPPPLSHAYAINLKYLCHKGTHPPPTNLRVVFYEWSLTQFTILKVRNTFRVHKAMKRGSSHVYIINEMYSLMFSTTIKNISIIKNFLGPIELFETPHSMFVLFSFLFFYIFPRCTVAKVVPRNPRDPLVWWRQFEKRLTQSEEEGEAAKNPQIDMNRYIVPPQIST